MLRSWWRILVPLAVLAFLSLAGVALAQSPVTWLRGYPERTDSNCVYYIAAWSDGSYTSTPWECDAGSVAVNPDGVKAGRGYPELGVDNCVWYVTQWEDGTYTNVPFSCPAGLTAYLPGTEPAVQPVSQPPAPVVEPPTAPAPTATPRPAPTATPLPAAPARSCCRVCTTGKACGNSCINRNYTCRQPPGCACDG